MAPRIATTRRQASMSDSSKLTRREAIARGGAVAAGAALFPGDVAARLAAVSPQEAVIPWTNAPAPGGNANTLDWQGLTSFVTPTPDMFRVGHYGMPEVAESDWSLEITGLVERPRSFSLAQIRSRPRQSVTFALECAGNRGFGPFMGAVHNAEWTGTPLAPVLEEAGVRDSGIEVVFWGSDEGTEEIRDNEVTQNFARSMSIEDAMDSKLLLAYEVNGEALPTDHGFPLRLVAPGWYGVANVKWLKRIEIRDTRFMGRFMARDYVTLREEERDGETVWTESSVGRARINSIPAKVVRGTVVGTGSTGPRGARTSLASRCERTTGPGGPPPCSRVATTPTLGRFGPSTGMRRPVTIPSPRERSTSRATCNRRLTIPWSRTN